MYENINLNQFFLWKLVASITNKVNIKLPTFTYICIISIYGDMFFLINKIECILRMQQFNNEILIIIYLSPYLFISDCQYVC